MVVIDISDAFMSLGVTRKEVPHTLALHITKDGYYALIALLFGYNTAPLLWRRVGALLARLLQSLVQGHEGQHWWCFVVSSRCKESRAEHVADDHGSSGFQGVPQERRQVDPNG